MMLLLAWVLAAEPGAPLGAEPQLSWSVYGRSGASVFVSSSRTVGGEGGGLGIQLSRGAWLAEAEANLLVGLGTVFDAQLAAGWQRRGRWSPAALLTFSVLAGSQTLVLTDAHPLPVHGPALAVGLKLEPLRFVYGRVRTSALQLGAGVGSDFPGAALSLRVTFIELGVSW